MSIVVLLVLVGLVLMGTGISRGNAIALVIGSFLLCDAVVFYVIFGPAAQAARTIFSVK